jgi:GNAT superfamily N-acetyltransferase
MAEFYAESGYELNSERASRAFTDILTNDRLGYVWLIQAANEYAGHVVLTLRYAMEYGGLVGCLDDLYVRPSHRKQGLSSAALFEVGNFCRDAGIRALTVEVGHNNVPAQALYRRAGFAEAADRQLLALPLAAPTHIV